MSNDTILGELLDKNLSPEPPSHDEKLRIFSLIPPSSKKGRGNGIGINNLLCLHEEATTKS